jgi:hypothetical protein
MPSGSSRFARADGHDLVTVWKPAVGRPYRKGRHATFLGGLCVLWLLRVGSSSPRSLKATATPSETTQKKTTFV